ncbi:hypothetical protein SDC9_196209 [bioreactor metagenome]|uniref:Uncharacterized protein n=1 Tax=bioreactor metagenome TaxID=1076179 RepID=A0A645IDQ9_9ZZZZ
MIYSAGLGGLERGRVDKSDSIAGLDVSMGFNPKGLVVIDMRDFPELEALIAGKARMTKLLVVRALKPAAA